ncbi:hypothetical protein TNCV_677471 [Trichonephila clavipes]|nr:hypothetical protein TNCV_677471 [Trichonephila clavipes]
MLKHKGEGITVWADISPGGHDDLHAFYGRTLADGTARTHRAVLVEHYLQNPGLEQTERSAQSSHYL